MIREKQNSFGIRPLCMALGIARASYYRVQSPITFPNTERSHPRALSVEERQAVLSVVNSERFCDQAPGEV